MADDEAECWREVVANLPAGLLTATDRVAVEALARLLAASRRQGLTGAERGALLGFLRELGATPASRGRVRPVGAAEAPRANPWDVQG